VRELRQPTILRKASAISPRRSSTALSEMTRSSTRTVRIRGRADLRLLEIAPSAYHERVRKRREPQRRSAREQRDDVLKPEILRFSMRTSRSTACGRIWRQMRREGFSVARCTIERLMRDLGLQGVIRGKPKRTTVSDKSAPCPLDRVNRQFKAPTPNRLWVSDFTYVATWAGFFIGVRHRRVRRYIVGWRVSRTAHASFVLDALEQAIHAAAFRGEPVGHHSDRGSHTSPFAIRSAWPRPGLSLRSACR